MQIFTYVRRIALLMVGMALSVCFTFAQERTVTGKVTAEGEGPLPGVNVTVQGTTVGAITSLDGGYSLVVPGPSSILVFSSIGYVTQAITVGSRTTVDVLLLSDVKALSEVVVTGYTQQRRRDLTGSIATVAPAELTAIPTGNVTNALQGRSAGVTVIGSGVPGETSRIRIRGFSSFENNDPLYIVDGVPTQDISQLNPADVASISVLKDAGAASIYGSRASNGVIIVSTKKGTQGAKVSFSMYYGTQDPGKGPAGLCNAKEFADLQWLVYRNDGTTETHPVYGSSTNASPTFPNWAADTDWYDAITHKAPIQNYDLSLSGGSQNSKFFAGIGVFRQDGVVIYTGAQKFSARFNSEFSFLKDRVKIGENLTLAYRTHHGTTANNQEGSPIQNASYRSQPIIPPVITVPIPEGKTHNYQPGDWGGTGIASRLGNNTNEVANLTNARDDISWGIHMTGSAFVDVKIIQGLNFKSTIGGNWDNDFYNGYTYATYWNAENTGSNAYSEGYDNSNDWVWTNQLTFDKTFGQSKILLVGGYEAVEYGIGRGGNNARASYFSDDPLYRTLSNGAKMTQLTSYLNTPTTLVSQFLRGDYTFMDKYMLSATVRRDGSSRFGMDTRYGVFPSFSAGWRIKSESFLTDVDWMSDLKIRGSYGTMGNQLAVSPMNQFYTYGGDAGGSFYDVDGTGNSSVQGFSPTRIGNPNAKWESNITYDIGFDASLFDNKVGIKFDWYTKNTKDLLYNPEVPGTVGQATAPYVNIASMSNKGVDLELSYRNQWGDFGFDGSTVISTVNNKITKIAEGVTYFDSDNGANLPNRISGNPSRNMVDHPMSAFFGYNYIGLFRTAADLGEVTQTGAELGLLRFADTDGDKVITPEDRTFIGDPNPNFTFGLNLAFTYKNFDLTAFLYGSQGNDIFNWNKWWTDFWPSFEGEKSVELLTNSWTTSNPDGKLPKATTTSNFSSNTQISSYLIEDGSFIKLKNLQLGYNIPESVLSRVNIGSIRVYLQGINLFTITKYSGLDPELGGNDTSFGVDGGNYPLVKQYLIGVNVNF